MKNDHFIKLLKILGEGFLAPRQKFASADQTIRIFAAENIRDPRTYLLVLDSSDRAPEEIVALEQLLKANPRFPANERMELVENVKIKAYVLPVGSFFLSEVLESESFGLIPRVSLNHTVLIYKE